MVADADAAEDRGAGHDADVVTDGRAAAVAIAQGDELQAVEVAADALGVEVGGVAVLEVGAGTYRGAPDVQRALPGAEPGDERRAIVAHAIIKEVAECPLPCHRLDEVQGRRPPVLHLPEVVGEHAAMRHIQKEVWHEPHGGGAEQYSLRDGIHCCCKDNEKPVNGKG